MYAAADHESRNPHFLLYEPEIVCWPTTTSSTKNNSSIVDEKRSCSSTKCFNPSSKNKMNASTRTRSGIKHHDPSPYYTNGTTYTHHDIYEHCTPNNTNLLLTDSAIGHTTSSSSSSSQQHSSSCSNDLFGYTFHRLNLCMKNSAKSRKALQRFKRQKKCLLKKHHHPRKRYSNRNDRHRRHHHHHRHHPQVQKYDMAVREEDGEIVKRHHMHHHRADKKNTPTISFPQEAPAPEPANAYTRAEDYSIPATTSTTEYCKFMFSSIEPTLSNPDDNTNSISSSSSFLPTQKQVAGSSTTASISTTNTPVIRNPHDPMTKADSSLDMLVGTTTTLHAGCASSANRTASIFHNAGERLPQYHHRSSNNNQMVTTSSIPGAADLEPISWSPRAAAAAANADGGVHDFTTDGVHVCAFLEKHAILSSLPRTTILSIIPLAGQNSL